MSSEHRKKGPAHQVLNPNQSMKAMVLAFKEETVREILSLVPSLPKDDALPLLERGDLE